MKNFIKTYKEELLVLPLLIVVLMVFKYFLSTVYPETAQFDLASETETIFWAIVKLIVFTSAAWFALRIVFPKAFRYLKDKFYQDFDQISCDEKRGLSLKIFFAFLFALVFLSSGFAQESQIRSNLQFQLESQLHVREATGNNDGVEVEKYLASVGLSKGYPWCAAFTTWNLNALNVPNPQSAWSPNWAKSKDQIWSRKMVKTHQVKSLPQPGDCFTIYYPSLNRVGHVGFYTGRASNGYFITIEGNTNNNGSRQGIGVFKRKRHPKKIYAITNYITPYYETNDSGSHGYSNVFLQYDQRNKKSSRGNRLYKNRYSRSKKGHVFNNPCRLEQDKSINQQAIRKAVDKEVPKDHPINKKSGELNRSNLSSGRTSEKDRITGENYHYRTRATNNSNSRIREKRECLSKSCQCWNLSVCGWNNNQLNTLIHSNFTI